MSVPIDIKAIQTKKVSHICRQGRTGSMAVPKCILKSVRPCIFRAIWEMVIGVMAALSKTRGYELHQAVLDKVRP